MAQKIRELMSKNVVTLPLDATAQDAARLMRENDIGPILVTEKDKLRGIVTDRDIVVRAIAEGRDPATTPLSEIISGGELAVVDSESSVGDAVRLMREKAVRRIPVVEGDRPIGIVSIGDLAIERDPDSALADISEEPANK